MRTVPVWIACTLELISPPVLRPRHLRKGPLEIRRVPDRGPLNPQGTQPNDGCPMHIPREGVARRQSRRPRHGAAMGAGLSEKIVIWWGERLHVHSAFTSVGVARSATLGRSSVFRPGERFP